MKLVLFELFGIKIYGYGTMIAIGIIAGVILLHHRVKTKGYDEDSVWNMIILTLIFGVLGGKLVYIITDLKNIIQDPSLLKSFGDGFVIYGAILGGLVGILIYCRRKKWNAMRIFDLVVPSVSLGQAFGRIGCFLAGCCYGRATELPVGVEFKNTPFCPAGVIRHPTQLYSSAFDFVVTIFLLWFDKKNKKDGQTFAMYFILYSIGRFIVEFLREDPRGNVGILSTSQFIGIFILIIGILVYNWDKIIRKKAKDIEVEEVK